MLFTDWLCVRLQAYQFKIQQKQMYLEQMADILKGLNQEVPDGVGLGEEVEWDDEADVCDTICLLPPHISRWMHVCCAGVR